MRGRDLAVAVALGVAAAVLYGFLWSGRYYHDGPLLLSKLERGDLVHFHLLYLPLAAGLHAILAAFGFSSPEAALAVGSVLSGVGIVVGCYALAPACAFDRVASQSSLRRGAGLLGAPDSRRDPLKGLRPVPPL